MMQNEIVPRKSDDVIAAKKAPYENEFNGKRVLVTGGTKGAGKAIFSW